MSLRSAFLLFVALFLAVSLSAGAVAVRAIHRLEESLAVAQKALDDHERAEQLRDGFRRSSAELTAHLAGDKPARAGYEAAEEQVVDVLDGLEASLEDPADREVLASLRVDLRSYELAADRTLYMARRQHESFLVMRKWLTSQLYPALERKVNDLRQSCRSRLARAEEEAVAQSRRARTAAWSGGLLLTAVGLLGFLWVRRSLIRPIGVLVRSANRIGRGEFAGPIPLERKDELGQLAREIEAMAGRLEESRQQLVRKERLAAVGEITASVAHNLRNPLASISGLAQVLRPEVPDQSREKLEVIIATVKRTDRWLRDLLKTFRPLRVEVRPEDLGELLDAVARAARGSATRDEIELELALDPDLPQVELDRSKIEQALLSLLFNALEASPPGGRVELSGRRDPEDPGRVAITITDEGPGMAPETLRRAFHPSFTTKTGGTGMGLYLSQRVIAGHHGAITAVSEPGRGCRMLVSLPLSTPRQADPDGEDPGS